MTCQMGKGCLDTGRLKSRVHGAQKTAESFVRMLDVGQLWWTGDKEAKAGWSKALET